MPPSPSLLSPPSPPHCPRPHSPLYPSTVETVHLPLLALSSGTRSLGSLILADLETGVERTLAELGYVFVHPPRTQNQTEMGLEPGAGATRGLTHGVGVPVVA